MKKDKGKIKRLTAIITSGVVLAAILTVLVISGNDKSESKGSGDRKRHKIVVGNVDTSSSSTGSTTGNTTGETDEMTTGKDTTDSKSNLSPGSETGKITTESTTGSDAGSTTEKNTTEKTTKGITEYNTERTTKATTRSTTESSTERTTRTTTRSTTESTTEHTTEPSTEKTTKTATESTTERTTESTTEKTTRVTTEKTTVSTTESTNEETTRHTHNYKHAPAYDNLATCSEDGVKVYLCDCGASKTEVIKATGKHNWVWKTHTEIIHHDVEYHQEPKYSEGYWENIYATKYHCGECNTFYDTRQLLRDHQNESGHGSWGTQDVVVDKIWHEPEIIGYTDVIDKEAWDEELTVKDYQYCTYCGKMK